MDKKEVNKFYPLLTMLTGLISFLISGIISGLLSLKTNEGLLLILGVPVGSLLMLYILRKLSKDKVLYVIILSEIGGFLGIFAGFMVGELLAEIVGYIFPSLKDLQQVKSQIIPNIGVLIFADVIFGSMIGSSIFGRKSIGFFVLVCGIASIPFGILLSMTINIARIGFDQNLLITLVSFGTTTGLSIGLYRLLKLKNKS